MVVTPTPTLPHHSKRIAAQPLSCVPVSKQGEILVMQRMGFIDGRTVPSTADKGAYDSVFHEDPTPSPEVAMRELFPELLGEGPRRSTRRASRRV